MNVADLPAGTVVMVDFAASEMRLCLSTGEVWVVPLEVCERLPSGVVQGEGWRVVPVHPSDGGSRVYGILDCEHGACVVAG